MAPWLMKIIHKNMSNLNDLFIIKLPGDLAMQARASEAAWHCINLVSSRLFQAAKGKVYITTTTEPFIKLEAMVLT